jgi:hypothetical protein
MKDEYVGDKLFIYQILVAKYFSFINHVLEKIFQRIIIEMKFNLTKFRKKKFKLMYIFGRKIHLIVYVTKSSLKST